MYMGRIIGHIEARIRLPNFEGRRLLLIQPVDFREKPIRWPIVACDCTGSGGPSEGSLVAYVEGREAANPFDPPIPVDACVVALIDAWEYDDAKPQS